LTVLLGSSSEDIPSVNLVAMARFGARFKTAALLVLHVGQWHAAVAQAAQAQPCATLSGPEALTCQWKEDSEKCIQQKCQDCSGDQCLSCQKDTKLINECCKDNAQVTASPILCKSAALAASINSCINSRCNGCAGEQCQVCKEDENTISKCCEGDYHNVELPEICGHDESHSCSGLAGEERLTCSWGEEVRSCMKTFCSCDTDDATDACKLCQEDMAQISMCCDQHRQSAHPPRICTDAILTQDVMNCIDTSCSSCEGERSCKLCKEDTNLVNQCCIDHQHGLDPPPMCQHISQLVLP